MSLAAGRYMETVGFMSMLLPLAPPYCGLTFDRRIRQNRRRLRPILAHQPIARGTRVPSSLPRSKSSYRAFFFLPSRTRSPPRCTELTPGRDPQYAYHANTTDFDTATGREISKELKATAERFNLTWEFGVAPRCSSFFSLSLYLSCGVSLTTGPPQNKNSLLPHPPRTIAPRLAPQLTNDQSPTLTRQFSTTRSRTGEELHHPQFR